MMGLYSEERKHEPRTTPINRTTPKEKSLADALAEQYARETGLDRDHDGYLSREVTPTQAQRAHRDIAVITNQPEKLN